MSPNRLPNLSTERLDLRQRSGADLPDLLAMDADPDVMRFIGDGRSRDPEENREAQLGRIRANYGEGLGYWSVFIREAQDLFAGWVCLTPLPGHPDIELGYRFNRAAWGNGYATEAGRACLAYGFDVRRLPEIVAVVDADNRRSLRVLSKLGFAASGSRFAYGAMLNFYRLRQSDYDCA